MRCLPFTLRIEGDYSCEVKSNDRIRRGLKSNRRECLNCGQEPMKSAGHAHKSFKSRRRESVTSRQNPFGNSGALLGVRAVGLAQRKPDPWQARRGCAGFATALWLTPLRSFDRQQNMAKDDIKMGTDKLLADSGDNPGG